MGTAINWGPISPSADLLMHPLYLKYSQLTYGNITPLDIKNAIKNAQASNDSAELVTYLSSILRVLLLVA